MSTKPEFWLSGPLPDIPGLLQPIAHTLLQVQSELYDIMIGFPEEKLWDKPKGLASVGFHIQHITGVLDRLFTYAHGESLSDSQLLFLKKEGLINQEIHTNDLLHQLDLQIKKSCNYLKSIDSETLTQQRLVGRKQIPSTKIGLIFHAAEHSMRHLGQLLVTVKMLK